MGTRCNSWKNQDGEFVAHLDLRDAALASQQVVIELSMLRKNDRENTP